jgi:hypothetical protein
VGTDVERGLRFAEEEDDPGARRDAKEAGRTRAGQQEHRKEREEPDARGADPRPAPVRAELRFGETRAFRFVARLEEHHEGRGDEADREPLVERNAATGAALPPGEEEREPGDDPQGNEGVPRGPETDRPVPWLGVGESQREGAADRAGPDDGDQPLDPGEVARHPVVRPDEGHRAG